MKLIKKLLAISIGIAVSSSAFAGPVVDFQVGDLTFYVAKLYSTSNLYSPGTNCTSAALCAPFIASAPTNAFNGESSWGVFTISEIDNTTTGTVVWNQSPGNYISGMFGGLVDYSVSTAAGQTTVLDTGGWLNLYSDLTSYVTPNTTSRTGDQAFTGITGTNNLLLSTVFQPGVLGGDLTTTSYSQYEDNSIGGATYGFLGVTGGSWDSTFLLGGGNPKLTDPNGGVHNSYVDITYSQDNVYGWNVNGGGYGYAAAPEPSSLAMIGLGLFALSRLRRRKD